MRTKRELARSRRCQARHATQCHQRRVAPRRGYIRPPDSRPFGTIWLTVDRACSETGGGWRSCPGPTAPGSGQLGAPSIGRVYHVVPSTAVATVARLLLEASRPQGWRYPPYRRARRHSGLHRGHLCDGRRSRLTAQRGRQRSRGTRVRGRVIGRTVARLTSWRPRNRKPGGLPRFPPSWTLRRTGEMSAAPKPGTPMVSVLMMVRWRG